MVCLVWCSFFVRDWNCDVASLKLIKMRKFKSSTMENKQETRNINMDAYDEKDKEESIKD